MKFIDPRIDFAFKKIFGSEDTKEILISFLESLLDLKNEKRIKEITILDPYQLPKIKGLKTSVLDVKCKDHRGITYIVEMQIEKALDSYLSCHITKETETGENYLQDILFYFIELSKFRKKEGSLKTILDKWIFFIKEASDLEDIPQSLKTEPFLTAFEKAKRINMDEEEFEYYEKAGMAITDTKGSIELAMEEGMEKGKKEGILEGSLNMLKSLYKQGILSKEQFEKESAAFSNKNKE
jgi:hypothetical protein